MAITKQTMDMAVEQIKDFFKNLLNPNMKIEDIADIVSSRLDPIIINNEKKGLHYSAGKFYVRAVDEKNFQLEFEMFFKDDDGKWHKLANTSEPREMKLLEQGAAVTLQKLKSIEFPINAPEIKPAPETEKVTKAEAEKPVEEKITEIDGVKTEGDAVTVTLTESEVKIEK